MNSRNTRNMPRFSAAECSINPTVSRYTVLRASLRAADALFESGFFHTVEGQCWGASARIEVDPATSTVLAAMGILLLLPLPRHNLQEYYHYFVPFDIYNRS